MLGHQRVHRLDSLCASLVEQSSWRRSQGGERESGQAVLDAGPDDFPQSLLDGRPHVGIVIQRVRKTMLFGRDGKTGILQLHRAGSGGQSFLSEIPCEVTEESVQGMF